MDHGASPPGSPTTLEGGFVIFECVFNIVEALSQLKKANEEISILRADRGDLLSQLQEEKTAREKVCTIHFFELYCRRRDK